MKCRNPHTMVAVCYNDLAYENKDLACVVHSTAWKNTTRDQLATAGGSDFAETVLGLLFDVSLMDCDMSPSQNTYCQKPLIATHLREALLRPPPAFNTAMPPLGSGTTPVLLLLAEAGRPNVYL